MNLDHALIARRALPHADNNAALTRVTTGMSAASVFRIDGAPPRFIKVASGRAADALRDEVARTRWLATRGVTVPAFLGVDDRHDAVAVLMTAIDGSSADVSGLPTTQLATALGEALAKIHALPSADCPFDETLAKRLSLASSAVDANEADAADFEERNRDVAPSTLLRRLQAERPAQEDIVVVHGDATLSNVIISNDASVGFLDCGNAGRSDRYTDLALLHADLIAHRGAAAGALFLTAYGERDWSAAKARFFLDLYELF